MDKFLVKKCDLGCGRPVVLFFENSQYYIGGVEIFPSLVLSTSYADVFIFCCDCGALKKINTCVSGEECFGLKRKSRVYMDSCEFYAGSCLYCWHQAALMLLEQRKERKQ